MAEIWKQVMAYRLTVVAVIMLMSLMGVVAIVFLAATPNGQQAQTISVVIAFLTPSIIGLFGLLKGEQNASAIQQVHSSVANVATTASAAAIASAKAVEASRVTADIIAQSKGDNGNDPAR